MTRMALKCLRHNSSLKQVGKKLMRGLTLHLLILKLPHKILWDFLHISGVG
ncbi:hypothetical protein LINPERPRIM_LOCUS27446 [Linum perenne]